MASVIGPYVRRQAINGQSLQSLGNLLIYLIYIDLCEKQTRGHAVTGADGGLS
jgi:hypothetical protein